MTNEQPTMLTIKSTPMDVFEEKLYCGPPCGQELFSRYSLSNGFESTYHHRCANDHVVLKPIGYPRIVHKPSVEGYFSEIESPIYKE